MDDLLIPDTSTDRILRLALLACACDRRSALTRGQRETIVQLGRQEGGVPLDMILPLREPVLAWCDAWRPRLLDVVEKQYQLLEQRTEDGVDEGRQCDGCI
jgi:hypothetical protein